jgi:hypothetical protein
MVFLTTAALMNGFIYTPVARRVQMEAAPVQVVGMLM